MQKFLHIVPLLLAFGPISSAHSDQDEPKASVEALLEVTTRGTGVDFDPLDGPAEALRVSDLIVVGTLVDVIEGIRITDRDSQMAGNARGTRYLSYVLAIDRVLWPLNTPMPDTIEVQVLANTAVTAAEVAQLNTGPRVLAALDHISTNALGASNQAVTTNGVESKRDLFFPYTDLFWFDSPAGMLSHRVDSASRSSGWRDFSRTVDELASTLENYIDRRGLQQRSKQWVSPAAK